MSGMESGPADSKHPLGILGAHHITHVISFPSHSVLEKTGHFSGQHTNNVVPLFPQTGLASCKPYLLTFLEQRQERSDVKRPGAAASQTGV